MTHDRYRKVSSGGKINKTVIIGSKPLFEKCVKWFHENYGLYGIVTKFNFIGLPPNSIKWAKDNKVGVFDNIPEYDTLFSILY